MLSVLSPETLAARLAALPDDLLNLLYAAGSVGMKRKVNTYLVGGFVRDLLLGVPNLDVDLVIEGDAISAAKAMLRRFGGDVSAHERFGTATWTLDHAAFTPDSPLRNLKTIDFISARRETYTQPGALPSITPSTIDDDLRRRDFTLNAIAIYLDDARAGQWLDPFNGMADLNAGLIRVLHDQSFVDDPTRIFRAVRYEQRFGFRIEPHSESLVATGLPLIARVSGERITNELLLIGAEREPAKALRRLHELGALQAIHPELRCDQAFNVQRSTPSVQPIAYLAALTCTLSSESVTAIAQRLALSQAQTQFITQVNRLWDAQAVLSEASLRPSQIASLLRPCTDDALRVGSALSENPIVVKRLEKYRTHWRDVKPMLNGDDLRALGIPPGPIYREILAALRDARLDGRISMRAEEERMAVEWGTGDGVRG